MNLPWILWSHRLNLFDFFSFEKSYKHSQVNSQVILIIISFSDNPCGIWYIVYMPCQCNVVCQNENEKTHKSTSQLWWPINLLQVYHQFYFGDNKKWETFFTWYFIIIISTQPKKPCGLQCTFSDRQVFDWH